MLPGLRAAVGDAQSKAAETRRRKAASWAAAEVDPVAQVLVDVTLAHLDRTFEYAVPAAMAAAAVAGARVKVRFAGRDVDGFVVGRSATAVHSGRLQPLRRVVSPEPVLSVAVAELCELVARRYAGTRGDVLRLAVPPRHAATERKPSANTAGAPGDGDVQTWSHVPRAAAFLSRLTRGESPRAVWSAAPGDDWPSMIAAAVASVLSAGRGSIVCVPDQRDVRRLDAALTAALGPGHHVVLTADVGPASRYEQFLAVSRGVRKIVIGTRSAAFAPVHDLGLVVIWDDGDDLHAEPRAPYPHAREVLMLRADQEQTAALIGGFACTPEAHLLMRQQWAHHLGADRTTVRQRVRIDIASVEERGVANRLPGAALDTIRTALSSGPVLVQTPRAGYVAALACERCRESARCPDCSGPLMLSSATNPPSCRWCAHVQPGWRCVACGHRGLRAPVLGEARTAEELGRSFPGVTVRSSSGSRVLAEVGDHPAIVVSTVGAEPVASAGYAAVVILDTWLTLAREDLRVNEEALRRWMGAVGLVRPGGSAAVVGDPVHPVLQALLRWDPLGHASREWDERASAHLPPAAGLATISGSAGAVDDALILLGLPSPTDVLGPVPTGEGECRVVLRVPLAEASALTASLGELQRVRSARKLDPVRIQVDPREI